MMHRLLILSSLALALTGGVALADSGRQGGMSRDHRGGQGPTSDYRPGNSGRDHRQLDNGRSTHGRNDNGWNDNGHSDRGYRSGQGSWNDNGNARPGGHGGGAFDSHDRGRFDGNHGYIGDSYGHDHFGTRRPVIRERYSNYYQRPSLVVEQYGERPGFYWAAGSWQWNGDEWIWQPGHYEADQTYDAWGGY